jgi:hypothetical protein
VATRSRDRHHIIPRVRCRDLGIKPNFPGNVIKVRTSKHRAWHTLFGSLTPDEAIEVIKSEWSLPEEAQAHYESLKGNVRLLKRKR